MEWVNPDASSRSCGCGSRVLTCGQLQPWLMEHWGCALWSPNSCRWWFMAINNNFRNPFPWHKLQLLTKWFVCLVINIPRLVLTRNRGMCSVLVFHFSCMDGFVLAPPWLLFELGILFGLSWGTEPLFSKQWRWVSIDNHQLKVFLQWCLKF